MRQNFSSFARRGNEAFTLVELLVGMTVGILLVVILSQVFSLASSAWRRGENQADAYREARAALQLMVRDISMTSGPFPKTNAAASPMPTASPAVTPTVKGAIAPVLVLDRYPGSDANDTINEQAYCLTMLPYGASSTCAVGYYCHWIPTRDAGKKDVNQATLPHAYGLMRQFLDSDKTFTRIKQANAGLATGTAMSFLSLFSRDLAPAPAPVELAAYVWDLEFRVETTLKAKTLAAAQPPRDASGVAYGTQPPYPEALPKFVEIRFKALSANAARQLEGGGGATQDTWANPPASGTQAPPGSPWRFITPASQQFVARVPLYNAGLAATTTTSVP